VAPTNVLLLMFGMALVTIWPQIALRLPGTMLSTT
jgi:hypothetical protein